MEQIRQAALPYFQIVSLNNGREDYIATMTQWGIRMRRFSLAKLLAAGRNSKYLFTDPDFRYLFFSVVQGTQILKPLLDDGCAMPSFLTPVTWISPSPLPALLRHKIRDLLPPM